MWHAGTFLSIVQALQQDFSVVANRNYFIKNQKKDKKRSHEEEKTSNDGGTPRGGGGFEVIVTSQIDSFRASMRTVVLIRVILELILRV